MKNMQHHFFFQKTTLNRLQGTRPLETSRRVIRRIMSKELAMKFSLTGLGDKRQKTKLSFKDHPAANIVLGAYHNFYLCVIKFYFFKTSKPLILNVSINFFW